MATIVIEITDTKLDALEVMAEMYGQPLNQFIATCLNMAMDSFMETINNDEIA